MPSKDRDLIPRPAAFEHLGLWLPWTEWLAAFSPINQFLLLHVRSPDLMYPLTHTLAPHYTSTLLSRKKK